MVTTTLKHLLKYFGLVFGRTAIATEAHMNYD